VIRRGAATVALVALVVAGLSACSGGSPGMMTATAEFTDVGALASNATVEMAGIHIGHVSHIQVDGPKAKLTLVFPKSVRVPAGVVAQVRRGSILGPQLIELIIPPSVPAVPLLADKAVIESTDVRPDLEDLIKSGTDVIGALSASQLAQLVQEGAKGFGGEGGTLHQVIDNLDTVLTGFASRTAAITSIIKDLDTFSSALGPAAQANAQAISNLAQAASILDTQRIRLTNLLSALDTVSSQGVALLAGQLPQIADQLLALRNVTQAVANQQAALGTILASLQGHNLATADATVNNFIQVLNDFIICGLGKAGGSDNSPLNACTNVPQAGSP
jgi:virulence factor Mce-like protein